MNRVKVVHRNNYTSSAKPAWKCRLPRRTRYKRQAVRSFIGILLTAALLSAQDFPDVTKISLEDLMNVRVTSVSKREQKLGEAAAAVFVITQDDIRRSGARNIPEALRMAPGVEVARIDENKWAITARGFNGRFANKLLVLIDGRSVYTPLFSGVYWNVQDTMLEDVDRIEVIRGPGATLWGANAVNGVINIITKEASSTQKGILTADTGNELRGAVGARYGGKLADKTYYRIYSKYFDLNSSTDVTGKNAFDGWHATRGGFRVDSASTPDDSYTLQGDIYRQAYGETLTVSQLAAPYYSTFKNNGEFSGGNLLARWNHSLSQSKTSLQFYYDNTTSALRSLAEDHQNIYDIDFQHDIRIAESNELIWGLGYRATQDNIGPSENVSLNPSSLKWNLFSGFTQDEFTLFGERLRVTVGSKLEHNAFTGFEIQPNARLTWTMNPRHSAWTSIARAVRTPARTEEDMRLNAAVLPGSPQTLGLPLEVAILGDHGFKSEDMIAYEAGYRIHPTQRLSADFATFYNSYSNLLSAEPGVPFLETNPSPVHITAPLVAANKMSGATYGAEVFSEWNATSRWKLAGSYSFLKMDIHTNRDSHDTTSPDPGGASPRHQYYFRSSIDLPKKFEQDLTVRYVDALRGLNVPSYYSVDARIGWKPASNMELSFAGQNLLNDKHLEFIPDFITTTPTQVKRTFHVTLTWNF